LEWRQRFFEWEKLLFNDLLEIINTAIFSSVEEDKWVWMPEGGAVFTVKFTYRIVSTFYVLDCAVGQWNMSVFNAIWKSPAPSKVSGFVWQLLLGKIPTRNNLITRQILDGTGDMSCSLCGEEMETESHLVVYCGIALLVWIEIFDWLEVPFGLPHNVFSFFSLFVGCW
jgi:hypothetical protein